jgi:nucleotide-binding universal stress UspA family protein
MTHRVLAAIDNSASAQPVLDCALAAARATNSVVDALHVAEDGERTARALAESHGIQLHQVTGNVVESIWKEGEDDNVLLAVVGARGLPTSKQPVGHVALELITRLDKPVIVVPPDAGQSQRFNRIVVAINGGSPDRRVLEELIDSLTMDDLEIIVVHVDSEGTVPRFSDQAQHETTAYAHEYLARRFPTLTPVALALRTGEPAEQVLATCDETKADLILISWNQSLAPGRAPTVRTLLEHTHVPVMLTPSFTTPS